MKKILSITTSLCAAVCALSFGGAAAAFAETGEGADPTPGGSQYYPTTFETVPEFDSLDDYAVGGGKTLFLQNNVIYEYGGESTKRYPDKDNGETGINKTITDIYFSDGEFYYRTDDDKYYALKNFHDAATPDKNPPIEFTSTTETDKITQDGVYYYYDSDVIYVLKDHVDTPLEGFSNLKLYGETVYAVKENVLYTLNGTSSTPVKIENFEITKDITVGNALKKLASSADEEPSFVLLSKDAYMTEVDLDKVTEHTAYFTTGKTVKVDTSKTPTALLLYKAGNNEEGIAIIAVNGRTYLIHPKAVTEKTVYPFKDSEFNKGTATEGYIYSAPYESKGTRIISLPYGTSVTILKEIKIEGNAELNHDFYYVEYEVDEETTVKGYVRFGLLSTYTFNEDPPVETPDPDETYEDLVKPVILILIVLLLIAIAAGYLIFVGTSDKRKKKNEVAATDSTERDKR